MNDRDLEWRSYQGVLDERGRQLDRIHDKLDALTTGVASIDAKMDTLTGSVNDHEARIRNLEKSKWWMIGAGTAAGGLVSLILSKITKVPMF